MNDLIFSGKYFNNSPQRTETTVIPATCHEKVHQSKLGTRMTRIGRIFTDQRASASSAQSVFYSIDQINHLSAFICVYLRLICRKENQPQSTQRAQSLGAFLSVLCAGMKKIATNTTNSIRTDATGVRFSSYQFVAFFMFIYEIEVHSRLCGLITKKIIKISNIGTMEYSSRMGGAL